MSFRLFRDYQRIHSDLFFLRQKDVYFEKDITIRLSSRDVRPERLKRFNVGLNHPERAIAAICRF